MTRIYSTPPDRDSGSPSFSLIETMRLERGAIVRVERHLARMRASAARLGFGWRDDAVRAALSEACTAHPAGTWRVRVVAGVDGDPSVKCTEHTDTTSVWRIAFANHPVESTDPRLLNKTTDRGPYDIARRGRPDVDDVVLWNERGEVTESTIANVVAEIDGVKCTPPVSCGLLAGVLRGELLESGELTERVFSRGVMARAERVWLINSLRGWMEAVLVR